MSTAILGQDAQPAPAPHVDVRVDLEGLADLIWRSLLAHIVELGAAIFTAMEDAVHQAARALWDAIWHAPFNFISQVPPDLSYNFGPYRAIANNSTQLAIGGATLALVLLGLRTIASFSLGKDHILTHISGRLIPAVFLTLSYPALIARGIGLVNTAAEALGSHAICAGFMSGMDALLVQQSPQVLLKIPYLLLWLLLIFFGVRLVIRLAYAGQLLISIGLTQGRLRIQCVLQGALWPLTCGENE